MNNTNKFPQLETDRLILRELTYEDIPVVFTHFSNEEIARYQDALPAKNTEEAKEIIDWGKNLVKQKTGALWGIFLKDEGDFLGQVNCVFRSDNNFTMQVHHAELGYDLTPPYWGKGYMSEAVASVIPYIFTATKIDRIEAIIHLGNTRSHSLVKRAGFHKEGILRHYVLWEGELWDMVLFSLLKQDWKTKSR